MLEQLKTLAPGIITTSVVQTAEARGKKVATYRQFADGEHPMNLNASMRAMLRIQSDDNVLAMNLCDSIIQYMADRLVVSSIEADTPAGNDWVGNLNAVNRFDGLQMDVTEAALRDGDTFISVAFDNETGMPSFYHELAYDGTDGVVVVYDRTRRRIQLGIKIWIEDGETPQTRVNLYYPDRIEKYIGPESGGDLMAYRVDGEAWPMKWTDGAGAPLGVPFIHFRNRSRGNSTHGLSELTNMIPLQESLNRTLISMIMTAENTGFGNRVARGFSPPADLSPGSWIVISKEEPLSKDEVADVSLLEHGEISSFLEMAEFLVQKMGTISRTPSPEFMGGDNASGEALKQREIGLLGKVKKFQVKGGNSWEDVMAMAVKVAGAFAKTNQPPQIQRFNCRWANAEIRNDKEVVENVMKVNGVIGQEQTLKELAPVFRWNDTDVENIKKQVEGEATARLARAGGILPAFSSIPDSL